MEFRDLEIFVAVVRSGSFTRAAERCFLSQPAVSLAVRRLEETVGARLVERSRRGIRPTAAGDLVYRRSVELLAARESMRWEIGREKSLEEGELRLGTTDAVSVYLMPGLYRSFRRRYPGVKLRISVDASAPLARRVLGGDLDLAVLTLPAPSTELRAWPVVEERLVPVASPSHALARRKRVAPERLSGEVLIAYPAGSVTRGLIDRAFEAIGAAPRVEMELGTPEAMKRLVEVGLGFAVLPERLTRDEVRRGRLRVLSIRKLRVRRVLGFSAARGRPLAPAARAFIDLAAEHFDQPALRDAFEEATMSPAARSSTSRRAR
jgi:DNA-binding transcriptional LysR family regulator